MTEISPTFPVQPASKKKNNTLFFVGAIMIIALLIGGLFLLRQTNKPEETKITVTEKPEPTPTDEPEIDKETLKIQVVNGTGTPGQAGTVVEVLEKADYNPDNIETANADEYSDTVTSIKTKSSYKSIARDIKELLSETFDEITIETATLDEDNEFDIVIITGGDKYEAPTPAESTPTPTGSNTAPTETPTPTATPSPTPTP